MREILFRGKRISDGEWVEGCLGIEVNNSPVIQWCEFDENYGSYCVEESAVIPETISEYTGLTDKNGKKIFEGDILEGDLEDNLDPGAKWRSEVVWGKFGWMCKERQILPMDEFDICEGEVIGNVYDDVNLLEV